MKETLAIAQALADENRLRILMALDRSTLCLCHLTDILGVGASTVSKHLHTLTEAGLLTAWQEGRWRFYRWAENGTNESARQALGWVRESLAGDPLVRDDAARRAVVLQACPAPCPKTARSRVLFLCTGNSCRSQMAEGLLRKYAGDRFDVYSAGLDPRPIPPETFKVTEEVGVDIRPQRPKSVMDYLGRQHFGYVITVCPSAESKCPIFPGASYRLYWPFEDPAAATGSTEDRLAKFREVRDRISERIVEWLKEPRLADGGHSRNASRPHADHVKRQCTNGKANDTRTG